MVLRVLQKNSTRKLRSILQELREICWNDKNIVIEFSTVFHTGTQSAGIFDFNRTIVSESYTEAHLGTFIIVCFVGR